LSRRGVHVSVTDAAWRKGNDVKVTDSWYSERLEQPIGLARWGHYGTPVLVFPTAGGDAEEIERNGVVGACWSLIESGRIKLYSCDSVAGRAMVAKAGSPEYRMWLFNQFHHCVRHEIVPAIRTDMGGDETPIVATGASIGAFNALAVLCRFPDVFRAAVGMSGTYRIQRFLDGRFSQDLFFASPLDFLPGLEGEQLDQLRSRFAIIASGQGAWEDIGASWDAGDVLGRKGVPNRVDAWGEEWPHEWPTWRRMLPQYLDELC
jgi:esterase/lipase superfamily enzyme